MSLPKTLQVLHQMQQEGVIGRYAIGGAVAAFFYIEPGTTFDLDVFIAWEPTPSGLLELGPLYAYLMQRGYQPEHEAIMIEGWAVQFLPPGNPLVEEALSEAVTVEVKEVPTPIFTQEHLMAICLDTGRPKDWARLVQFVEEGKADQAKLEGILQRHHLIEKWQSFKTRFNLEG